MNIINLEEIKSYFFGVKFVCTIVGCIIFYQQIEEDIQGTLKALRHVWDKLSIFIHYNVHYVMFIVPCIMLNF
jgi:hypothetical protein